MINHLSYSSIKTYLDCGRAWRYRYQDQLDGPKSADLLFGSAVHKAIANYLTIGELLFDSWRDAWQNTLDSTPDIQWNGETPENLFNYGVKLFSQKDIQQTIQDLRPAALYADNDLAVEFPITLNVPGVSVPIIGYVDMIGVDMVPVDFKTAGQSWTQERADQDMQATFYLAALNQMGLVLLPARFKFIVLVKNKTPKVQVFETERTAVDVFRLFNLVGEVWRAIEYDIYIPNNTTYKCSPKYCQFWNCCKGGLIDERT